MRNQQLRCAIKSCDAPSTNAMRNQKLRCAIRSCDGQSKVVLRNQKFAMRNNKSGCCWRDAKALLEVGGMPRPQMPCFPCLSHPLPKQSLGIRVEHPLLRTAPGNSFTAPPVVRTPPGNSFNAHHPQNAPPGNSFNAPHPQNGPPGIRLTHPILRTAPREFV